jgi:hypothetical protein
MACWNIIRRISELRRLSEHPPWGHVKGDAESAVTTDNISRHIPISGVEYDRDVFIFAGSIGLRTPV